MEAATNNELTTETPLKTDGSHSQRLKIYIAGRVFALDSIVSKTQKC